MFRTCKLKVHHFRRLSETNNQREESLKKKTKKKLQNCVLHSQKTLSRWCMRITQMTHFNPWRDAQLGAGGFFSAVTADMQATRTHLHSLVWSCSKPCGEQPTLPQLNNNQKQIYWVRTATCAQLSTPPSASALRHIVDGFLELFQHHPAKWLHWAPVSHTMISCRMM